MLSDLFCRESYVYPTLFIEFMLQILKKKTYVGSVLYFADIWWHRAGKADKETSLDWGRLGATCNCRQSFLPLYQTYIYWNRGKTGVCKWATSWQNQQNDCAPSEDSDQPGHPPSLGSSLCAQWVAKEQCFLHADSEDSDQTGPISRLIWVFAGRTDHFVGFVMRRLKWASSWDQCTFRHP